MMKERCLMGILFCRPLMCLCRSSPSQSQLKLDNTPSLPSSTAVSAVAEFTAEVSEEVKNLQGVNLQSAINGGSRSCIRKDSIPKQVEMRRKKKKSVRWVDYSMGQELAEIKEFESSETGDSDNEEEERQCFCFIL
ncbi:unnamed protein product [Cuscuta epithymum]|uniref:Uncharacterized protein n=1 Tax=Cuscuta epithymum TaxID=186058 RepID=A0AAV0G4N4_9ASTE|nr:unnamed protein product [Cuscuta epithymum]CAH9142553.1 unnamed protein product [Cuscuta epithymum]